MEEIKNKKSRIQYIDVLRGIGILIMVMGHVGFGGKFDRYIHSFHMPLFFFISGYFFKFNREHFIKRIGHKAYTLLLPYVFFAAINYIFWLILEYDGTNAFSPILNLITFNTTGLPIAGALWFLTALFFADVFYNLIVLLVKDKKILLDVVVLVISVGMSIVTTYTEFQLPLAMDIALVAMGFIHLGRRFKEVCVERYLKIFNKWWKLLLMFIGLLLLNGGLAFVNGYVNMKEGWYAIIPLSWVNACIGTLAYFTVALIFENKNIVFNFIKNIFSYIGQHTIVFLGLNQLVICLLELLIGQPIGASGAFTLSGFLISCLITILAMLILSGLSFIIYKTPLKIFCGEKLKVRSKTNENS